MVCALTAARRGLAVCVLEKNDRCGKKLSQTGNGRCNYTNTAVSPKAYNSDSPETVSQVLDRFGWQDTVEFFEGIGIVPAFRDGYCYPGSGEARSFSDLLCAATEDAGAEVHTGCTVTGILKTEKGYSVSFERTTEDSGKKKGPSGKKAAAKAACENGASGKKQVSKAADGRTVLPPKRETAFSGTEQMIFCRNLVLAAGGAAAPKTGSTGDCDRFLKDLGLPVEKPLPALVPLHLGAPYEAELFGIRAQGKVSAFCGNGLLSEDTGEVQFTKEGLSGIPVMNVSSRTVRAFDAGKSVTLCLNLFPEGLPAETLFSIVKRSGGERPVSMALTGLLSYKSVPFFLRQAGLKKDLTVRAFQRSDAEKLCKALTDLRFPVTGYADFDRAQVTSGGLFLSSVSADTCEVKNHPGLYCLGEALNCDGRCGGFNLQWAFATGALAGKAIR